MGARVRTATVDWPRVILGIRGRRRMLVKDIAAKVGMSRAGLSDLQSGATREPCYSVGVRLLDLLGAAGEGGVASRHADEPAPHCSSSVGSRPHTGLCASPHSDAGAPTRERARAA